MGYDVNYDQYIDENTGILANKFHAKTQQDLDEIETTITSSVLGSLMLPKTLTLSDTLIFDLHKELFGDIYEWAGNPREIDISKGNSYFAHAAFIPTAISNLMAELRQDYRLKSDNKEVFVTAIAHYYSEFNAIHPFREGNGRTIRAFISLLVQYYGWDMDWTNLDKDANITASIAAMHSNERPMVDLLLPLVTR